MVGIELDGRIVFTLHDLGAERVEVVGAFDGWGEQRLPMEPTGDGWWRLAIDPGPGSYLFRYLVDGTRWVLDGTAHGTCQAADGTVKSRLWRPPLRQDPDSLAA
jgi:1,4-alpha-glucan branching enzyme